MGFYIMLCILSLLHGNRDREPLFSIASVPVPFPVPQCVYESLEFVFHLWVAAKPTTVSNDYVTAELLCDRVLISPTFV